MAKRAFAMLECQSLAENSSPFVHTKRPKRCSDVAAATESTTTTTTCLFPKAIIGYPELSAEPNSDWDRSVLCRICVRLSDGLRVQRNFLKSESVQLLWSFCYSQMDQSERNKPFKLFQAIPGYYKNLYYGSYTSFEQSGLANSLISVTWM